jgi:hypothetical protein
MTRVLNDPTLHLQDSKRRALASRFADKLSGVHPNFDRSRFLRACGVER